MEQETQTVIQKLNPQETKKALEALDQRTLQVAASVVSQVGFQHFHLSQDTRLPMEARKAHSFVAINCEEIAKKVLRLSGQPEDDILAQLRSISAQIIKFNAEEKERAKKVSSLMRPKGEGLQ